MLMLAALAFASCRSPARDQAILVIDELKTASHAHEDEVRNALEELCKRTLEQTHGKLDAERKLQWAVLRADVNAKVSQKQIELRAKAIAELDKTLEPILDRTQQQLESEKQQVRNKVVPSREREFELASQLSSTLAVAMREAENLKQFIDEELEKTRRSQLDAIDKDEQAGADLFDAEKEAKAVFTAWSQTNPYQDGMDRALTELRRYASTDDAISLYLQGLVGKGFGKELGDLLQKKAADLSDKVTSKVKGAVDKARASLDKSLNSATTKLAGGS
jgi:hypothetical protein